MTETWGQFKSFEGKKFKALDPEFTKEVSKLIGGQDLTACFQCAKCSAGCPVSDKVNIQIHEVMRMLLFGLDEVLDTDMVWLCTTCYTCQERCSQGVEIADIMLALRNIAVREGHAPKALVDQAVSLIENGRLAKVVGSTNRLRLKLGLPKLSTSSKDIIKKIVVTTGFDKLIEHMRE